MAFASTHVKTIKNIGGLTFDKYTFSGAGVTTGTITCQTTDQPEIAEVLFAVPSSNGDTAVTWAADAGSNKVKLTFTSADSGTVIVVGISA